MKILITTFFLATFLTTEAQIKVTNAVAKAGQAEETYVDPQELIIGRNGADETAASFIITGITAANDYKKFEIRYNNPTTGNDVKLAGEKKNNDLVFKLAPHVAIAKGSFRLFYNNQEKGAVLFSTKADSVVVTPLTEPENYNPAKDNKLLSDASVEANEFIRKHGIKADKRTNTWRKGNKIYLFVDAQGNYLLKGPPTAAFRQNTYIVVLVKRKADPFIYQLIPPVSFLSDQLNIYGDTAKIARSSSSAVKSGLDIIEFAELGPYEEEFNIQIKKTEPSALTSSNIIDTRIKVAKLYHVSIQGAMIATSVRDPQNIIKSVLPGGDSTLTADDPKSRGLFCITAVWYPSGRSFIFPPRGGLFSRERFGIVVGVRADKDQFKNFLGGLQFDFARGGSISFGAHYGRHTVVDGKKKFAFGKDVFTGDVATKVRQQWDVGAFIGVNIDIRILNFLFGGAQTAALD